MAAATATRKGHKVTKKAPKLHGQQAIDAQRVTQIQQALIRAHYLTGDATGKWDEDTVSAMQKYQASQGWQTKLTPDSRALVKLGLGPDYSNAINARDSSFAMPPAGKTAPTEPAMSSIPPQATGFAAAAGVSQ
jgi:peptidoglycan hydrolase-like protein with peptidoglycan-binding domain